MAGLTGREAKGFAFAKFAAGSWGVAASVTHGIFFESDGGLRPAPVRVNDEAFGQSFLGRGDLGDFAAQDVSLVARDRYNDHGYRWEALAMGSPATVTLSSSAGSQTTSWQHILDLAPSIDGLGLTSAIDKVFFVDELTSAKVYGFSKAIGDDASGVMNTTFRLMGSKMTNVSSINTRSTVHGASFPSLDHRVFRKNGVWQMNLQGGSTLAAGDSLPLEGWSFEFQRPQDAPHVTGQDYIYEPGDNGFPAVRVMLTYPRMSSTSANSLYQALRDDSVFKGQMTFSGAFINSTDRYMERFQFPALEFDTEGWQASVAGATQVKPTATFLAKLAATSPSGMAFVNPFRVTRIMTNSVHAFA